MEKLENRKHVEAEERGSQLLASGTSLDRNERIIRAKAVTANTTISG